MLSLLGFLFGLGVFLQVTFKITIHLDTGRAVHFTFQFKVIHHLVRICAAWKIYALKTFICRSLHNHLKCLTASDSIRFCFPWKEFQIFILFQKLLGTKKLQIAHITHLTAHYFELQSL